MSKHKSMRKLKDFFGEKVNTGVGTYKRQFHLLFFLYVSKTLFSPLVLLEDLSLVGQLYLLKNTLKEHLMLLNH